jgi:hypothetical protein
MMKISVPRRLIDAPSAPFHGGGGRPYHRMRGKLGAARAFAAVLRNSHLLRSERILDLGCACARAGTPYANMLLIARPR